MARGKYSKAISDRSGMEFPYTEMMKEWNGSFVHRTEYEEKHPQLELRTRGADAEGLLDARVDRTENEVIAILGPNPFETIAASSGIINVFEKSHGRSTSDTVRFRGAPSTSASFNNPTNFTNTTDFYHFTVDTNTATSGGVSGGGNNCSAGPATLTA